MKRALFGCALLMWGVVACAGATPASTTPTPATRASASSSASVDLPAASTQSKPVDPFAIEGALRDETYTALESPPVDRAKFPFPVAPKALPAAPASCNAFVNRRATGKAAACTKPEEGLAALDAALAKTDEVSRDTALVALESCAAFPAGMIRALRADFAPVECGDVLADSVVKKPNKAVPGAVEHTLFGQAVGAQLSRAGTNMPSLPPGKHDKQSIKDFTAKTLAPWLADQIKLIKEMGTAAQELKGYGRGIAGVEMGHVALRLVDAVRAFPLPSEFLKDEEFKNAYYIALDEGLSPFKALGRDATLAGLREFAAVGALNDSRVTRSRKLLIKVYAGQTITSLDTLALPSLTVPDGKTVNERLARKLPSFYTGLLISPNEAKDPNMLLQMTEQGVPSPHRQALTQPDRQELKALMARARLKAYTLYWRGVDADQTISLMKSGDSLTAEMKLMFATAIALRSGPDGATDLLLRPFSSLDFGKLVALDSLVTEWGKSANAGLAAYNSALIGELATREPKRADQPSAWQLVAKKWRAAAQLLTDAKLKSLALTRASEADDVALFLTQSKAAQ